MASNIVRFPSASSEEHQTLMKYMEAGTIPAEVLERTVCTESRLSAGAWRAIDIVGASLMLVLLSPLLAAVALAVRLDSPGRAIFRQRRVGRSLQPFTVYKFRSMNASAPSDKHKAYVLQLIAAENIGSEHTSEGLYKLAIDDRVTRVGRILRRLSLDELPQLWNVLRGEMSLVGPRPSIPYEVERYPDAWLGRFSVRPGLTGLWQVSGRSELTWEQMIELDLEYVERRTFWFNIGILLRTIPVVLVGRGAA
jgi:lipopolysaccharide/colanic/teichoic acid biosynthesis glycosyltransferase